MKRTLAAGLVALSFACNKDSAKEERPLETTPATAPAVAPAVAPATDTAALPTAAANRPSQAGESAFVTGIAGVRRAASEDKMVDDPKKPGKKISNYISTLHRGEQVQVLKVENDWAEVRSSDEKEGWLRKDSLLPSEGVTMATTLEEAKTFDRPDLLALNSKRKAGAGALIYVIRSKDQFSEVNLGGTSTSWMLTSNLVADQREVDAAKLLNKARYMIEKKDAGATDLLDLAKKEYGDTQVMKAYATAEATATATPTAPVENAAPAPAAPAPAPAQ